MEILFSILIILSSILKIVLLAVFYIILFALIIVFIILITPIKVKLRLNVNSNSLNVDVNNIKANVYITYLLKIFKISLIFDEGELNTNIKVFFLEIGNKKESKKNTIEKPENLNKVNEGFEEVESINEIAEDFEVDEKGNRVIEINKDEEVNDLNVVNENIEKERLEELYNEEKEATKENVKETASKEVDKENKKSSKEKINDILEKIKYVKEYPNKKLMLSTIFKHIFKILKSFKPKYINIKGKFGLDNPADTGQLLGIISILDSFCYLNIDLQPDFDNECIDTEVDLYVTFRLWTIVSNATVLAFKLLRLHLKGQGLTLRKLIKKLKNKKGDKNGK